MYYVKIKVYSVDCIGGNRIRTQGVFSKDILTLETHLLLIN